MSDTLYQGLGYLGAGLGAGLAVIGAGLAIGKASAALAEGTARQPEAAGTIRNNVQLFIFLIEGLGIVGLGVAYLIVFNVTPKAAPAHAEAPAVQDTVK